MNGLYTPTLRFLRREDGPTAVEYALVLALIVVVCIIAISALGSGVTKPFKKYSKSAALLSSPCLPFHRSGEAIA